MNELVESDEELNAADSEFEGADEGEEDASESGSLWDSDEERA